MSLHLVVRQYFTCNLDIASIFRQELRLVVRMIARKDIFEGVICKIVMKGGKRADWLHASHKEVTEKEIDDCFAMLPPDQELVLDGCEAQK